MDCSGPPNGETQTFLTAVCQSARDDSGELVDDDQLRREWRFLPDDVWHNDCSGNGVTQTGAAGDCVNQQLVGTCDAGAVKWYRPTCDGHLLGRGLGGRHASKASRLLQQRQPRCMRRVRAPSRSMRLAPS